MRSSVAASSGWRSVSPTCSGVPSAWKSRAANAGRARMTSTLRAIALARWSSIGKPSRARAIAGAAISANDLRAVALQRGEQTRHLSRCRHRQAAVQAELWHDRAVAHEHVARRRRRRGLAVVERRDPTRRVVVDQHEAAAADAARGRVDDAHRERGRHRGVDGVAARLEDLYAGLRGELVLGRDHAVAGGERGGRGREKDESEQDGVLTCGRADVLTCGNRRRRPTSIPPPRQHVSTSTRQLALLGHVRHPDSLDGRGMRRKPRVSPPHSLC